MPGQQSKNYKKTQSYRQIYFTLHRRVDRIVPELWWDTLAEWWKQTISSEKGRGLSDLYDLLIFL